MELDVRAPNVAIGMASLDEFRLPEIFKQRARVMQTVPLFLKGAFRGALRVAFEEAQCAQDNNDEVRHGRAWKLFRSRRRNPATTWLEEIVEGPRSRVSGCLEGVWWVERRGVAD